MKKIWIVFAAVAMVLALGTAAYAASDEDNGYQEMLPFMKQVHPDVSEQQLQEMYNLCHGDGEGTTDMMMNGEMGSMMNKGGMSNMMGNGSMNNMMNNPAATLQ